jgi:histidinol-phosphatase
VTETPTASTPDLALALSMADIADGLSTSRFRADDLVVDTKPDLTPVSEADRAVEQALRSELARVRPDDAVLGEEYGSEGTSTRRWILDPIDGTKNYVRGVPVWSTLIGLMEDGEVTVGVVSAPALGRRWWAARDHGAWATDPLSHAPRRLRVSNVSQLSDASFSFSDPIGWAERGSASGLERLLHDTWRQRAYGDFWSHMMVAEGVVDIAAEPQLETYDMAALIPIITEAGGQITAYDGSSALGGGSAVTTNGRLHGDVLALLTSS